ncbi:dihydroneopterin aldolase [Brevundimonas sp.]|jgi:dihydroneopterin aldolase|uniref:dihydroneopterin aldolase n=1 Tax=Brevundimonas sp. TaxID=1871086 RepID=UPI002E0E4A51|nr:dihydroneopterin aldolase [Brevundimonas sp.]
MSQPAFHRDGLTVFVRGLSLAAEIGVHAHERGITQPLDVDVTLELTPGPVEHLADTLNYELVRAAALDLVAQGHMELIETFAERLGAACLTDPRVRSATVRVEKPGALRGAQAAGCEVRLSRA